MLQKAGASVSVAVDGAEALLLYKEGAWDLVVLDHSMPVVRARRRRRRPREMHCRLSESPLATRHPRAPPARPPARPLRRPLRFPLAQMSGPEAAALMRDFDAEWKRRTPPIVALTARARPAQTHAARLLLRAPAASLCVLASASRQSVADASCVVMLTAAAARLRVLLSRGTRSGTQTGRRCSTGT